MDSDVPVGSSPSISGAADSVRRWIASVVLYIELRIRLLALESKDAGVHLLVFPCDAHRFSSVSADADLSMGMGLERIGLCRGVAHYQYRCGRNISVSDHQTALPNYLCRI